MEYFHRDINMGNKNYTNNISDSNMVCFMKQFFLFLYCTMFRTISTLLAFYILFPLILQTLRQFSSRMLVVTVMTMYQVVSKCEHFADIVNLQYYFERHCVPGPGTASDAAGPYWRQEAGDVCHHPPPVQTPSLPHGRGGGSAVSQVLLSQIIQSI